MAHGLWVCDLHRKRFCRECISDDVRRDAEHDRQYRLGYEQAWREWSACIRPASPLSSGKGWISDRDLAAMEKRLHRIGER